MIEIPDSLSRIIDPLGPHFCLVEKNGKNPNVGGEGWQKPENLMKSTDTKLQAWLKQDGNYGVVGGYGLVIVDIDLPSLRHTIMDKLPKTFTVQSPGSKGLHLYFLCGLEKPIRLRDKDGTNIGDVQSLGKMCVGPNSIHPNGNQYQIIDDRPLAQVTRDKLIEALENYVIPDREVDIVEATARKEKEKFSIDLDILQVFPLSGFKRRGDEYYGSHPVHGSETGQNCHVNPSKNCFHCFRHGTGGGPLQWLAIQEGIIDCSEAGPGALRGEKFLKVKQIAIEKGYLKEDLNIPKTLTVEVSTDTSLRYMVLDKNVKVKIVKNEEDLTAWVTLNDIEKLRTSRNAKLIRDLLKKEKPKDYLKTIEDTIKEVQTLLATKKEQPSLPEEEYGPVSKAEEELEKKAEEEAEEILNSTDVLGKLLPHFDNIMIGETENKQTVFVLLLAPKMIRR